MPLSLSNISKRFDDKILFKDFTCHFNDKGLYLLIGDSGVGKTTLLRIIAGLDKDFDGDIKLTNLRGISYCFQEYRLFPNLTAFDNVLLAAFDSSSQTNKTKVENMLLALGFSKKDMHLYVHELSGGMKQRISFARAILYDSDVLLLDEPTKELDSSLVKTVNEIIINEARERLVILISHHPEEIENESAIKIFI